MQLSTLCRRSFEPVIRGRGEAYFTERRVRKFKVLTDNRVQAVVLGSGTAYRVELDFSRVEEAGQITALCDCPHFSGGTLCKHVWAVVLTVEAQGPDLELGEHEAIDVFPGNFPDHEEEEEEEFPRSFLLSQSRASRRRKPSSAQSWQHRLERIERSERNLVPDPNTPLPGTKLAFYVIHAPLCRETGRLVLDIWTREVLKSGAFGKAKSIRVYGRGILSATDPVDRELLPQFARIALEPFSESWRYGRPPSELRVLLDPVMTRSLLPELASTGRLLLSVSGDDEGWDEAALPMRFDPGGPYSLEMSLEKDRAQYRLRGSLKRGDERLPMDALLFASPSGDLIFPHVIRRVAKAEHVAWLTSLNEPDPKGVGDILTIPAKEARRFVDQILTKPSPPELALPDELRWTEKKGIPVPRLKIEVPEGAPGAGVAKLELEISYDGVAYPPHASADSSAPGIADPANRTLTRRDSEAEREAIRKFESLLLQERNPWVPAARVPELVSRALDWGWEAWAQDKRIVQPSDVDIEVKSGIDWFELDGEIRFGDEVRGLPELLQGLDKNGAWVELGDGRVGILPESWLARYELLAQGARIQDGAARFTQAQALLLDGALGADPGVRQDRRFREWREKLRRFEGVERLETPKGFKGKLRAYQKDGLAWLCLLHDLGFGGILADDMGLGKTVQFLAFLKELRNRCATDAGSRGFPRCLVIAPKSLVFNWADEAARFVLDLRVAIHAGGARHENWSALERADLVLTTYSTLRLDIERIRELRFDIAVADEAQAIKNKSAQISQACKQVNAPVRFAMSGTPVENSLEDLFSILEFTHPGLFHSRKGTRYSDRAKRSISQTLRPILLRRKKDAVLDDLPEKTEQTLHFELGAEERRLYDELKNHYRGVLKEQIDREGIARSKIQVLEALLRLRQAACHPGLIDPKRKGGSSTKLDLLVEQLREVLGSGGKALVFSQFTSLLDRVEDRLKQEKIGFTRLDGKTVDRKAKVSEFQADAGCPVFLISLKAGGTGLNLTAASYIFLLDPWWNPAAEAQAIDRAHRIGQKQKVFAYRMIALGTVEEKIAALQQSKRELADSIYAQDEDFLKRMTEKDLQALLD